MTPRRIAAPSWVSGGDAFAALASREISTGDIAPAEGEQAISRIGSTGPSAQKRDRADASRRPTPLDTGIACATPGEFGAC
jgi:hypothetical protein